MSHKLRDFLKKINVETVLFCSGARNNKILELLGEDFEIEFHLDERAACFEAVGRAKFSGKPIVICTTSGTAVAECLPGLIEAYYSEIPLIVISADRPAYLRFTHAPQAIDQTNIFSSYTRSKYCGTIEDFKGVETSYPMQLNLEIDDSLNNKMIPEVKKLEVSSLANFKSSLILISEGHDLTLDELDILNRLTCLKYSECLAQYLFEGQGTIEHERDLKKILTDKAVDSIFHFGRTPTLKAWRDIEKGVYSLPVINVGRETFGLSRGYYTHDKKAVFEFLNHYTNNFEFIKTNLKELYSDLPNSEIALIDLILSKLDQDSIVFAGNSMPIRYLELLKTKGLSVLASRGANGIDGQIATLIGIAKETSKNVVAIIGDLTFLYDVGVLVSRDLPKNLVLNVINNNGGRIFERVAVDPRLINSHNKNLDELVSVLGLSEQVFIHKTENLQTNEFWRRWDR